MQISNYINHLEKVKRYSPHTLLAYRRDLEQFDVYLKSVYETEIIAEATFVMIRSYIVSLMDEGYVAKSVNRKISSLHSFYKYLRKIGEIEINPAAKMHALKMPKNLVSTISDKEMETLLSDETFFTADLDGCRNRAIIELFYATGIRRSELINLRLDKIDFSEHTIRVIGKGNKVRIIPFPAGLVDVLLKYNGMQPRTASNTGEFFLTNQGKKLYPKFVYNVVKHYLSFVSTAKKKSPHTLRHTYATHLLNQGADVNDIKELLGHANLSATQIYTHNSFGKLKTEYNQTHPREVKKK